MVWPRLKAGSSLWEVFENINCTVSRELKQKNSKCNVIKNNKPTGGPAVLFAKHAVMQGLEN
jgi:hypothetical protein